MRSASTGPGVTTIYIRGLSSDQAGIQIAGVAGTQPNVGLYLNDLPASTPGRNLARLRPGVEAGRSFR